MSYEKKKRVLGILNYFKDNKVIPVQVIFSNSVYKYELK
jgi:hypothetical protein